MPPTLKKLEEGGLASFPFLRCGAAWRDVPPKYGSRNPIYCQLRRWSEAAIWEAVSVTLAEILAGIYHSSIDSATVRARISVAGRKGRLIDVLLANRRGLH